MELENYALQVITDIPNVDEEQGNICSRVVVADVDEESGDPIFRPIRDRKHGWNRMHDKISVHFEVFKVGEILIVSKKTDKEVAGRQRAVYKFPAVSFETFEMEDIDKAIQLSEKVTRRFIEEEINL